MLTDERHTETETSSAQSGDHEIALAAEREESGPGPVRRCIATGEVRPKPDLIRFVLSPDGVVTPDLAEKLPGRGLWVSASEAALDRAIQRNGFARAARQKAAIPDNLKNSVVELLTRRCIEYLSLARRAGQAVTGFEKCLAQLKTGGGAVYTAAVDRGDDGAAKLERASADAARVHVLTREELGQAFGRPQAVHVVVLKGGLAQAFTRTAAKLAGVRSVETPARELGAGAEGSENE